VIIVLVGTSLETSALLARFYEERWQVTLHSIMPMEAEKAAVMYETEGPDKLRAYLDELQKAERLSGFTSSMKTVRCCSIAPRHRSYRRSRGTRKEWRESPRRDSRQYGFSSVSRSSRSLVQVDGNTVSLFRPRRANSSRFQERLAGILTYAWG
jgi:hypothetical protein